MNAEEGYVRFNCVWNKADFNFPGHVFEKLSHWRKLLFQNNLIGSYAGGIGFGNISIRISAIHFIISGTATGGKSILTKNDYALVTDYDLSENMVKCTGNTMASAETMSHAAIYDKSIKTTAVIHVHNLQLWEKLKDRLPTTRYDVEYGTPEMALEIQGLFDRTDVMQTGIFVMGGHKEGIIAFGDDLDEAGEIILNYLSK